LVRRVGSGYGEASVTATAGGAEQRSLQVTFTLPGGWVRLPEPGAKPKGLLRRDPFEVLARDIVASGAVIAPLVNPTRDYLRQMARADPDALGVACHIAAPSRTENTFANVVIVGPVRVPQGPDGDVDWDEVDGLAATAARGDSPHSTARVQLPWGRAVKGTWTRTRSAENLANVKHVVAYWAVSDDLGTMITVQGDVSTDRPGDLEQVLSDIDAIAVSVQLSAG
jgi:hypothetical protein